eukprot:m.109641 g.109641  ORF g.109641 m.109641 type:complete len:65 (+) comp51776_c0_seq8:77-271(+)
MQPPRRATPPLFTIMQRNHSLTLSYSPLPLASAWLLGRPGPPDCSHTQNAPTADLLDVSQSRFD